MNSKLNAGQAIMQWMRKKQKRPPGRPTPESSQAVDSIILQAAEETFVDRGFGGASLSEIAARAQTSRQTVYARYPNKEVLFKSVIDRRLTDLLKQVRVLLNEDCEPEVALRQLGEQLVQQFISSDVQRLHRVVIGEAASFPEFADTFFALGPSRGRKLLIGYLRSQVERKRLSIENIDRAAEQLLGSLVGPLVMRSTLRQAQEIQNSIQVREWVQDAVKTFMAAHRPSDGCAERDRTGSTARKRSSTPPSHHTKKLN